MNMQNIKSGMSVRQMERKAPWLAPKVRRTLAHVDEVLRRAAQSAKAQPKP